MVTDGKIGGRTTEEGMGAGCIKGLNYFRFFFPEKKERERGRGCERKTQTNVKLRFSTEVICERKQFRQSLLATGLDCI